MQKNSREEMLMLKAVLLYILQHCQPRVCRNVYYIVKTAYIAQQKHLAKYLCPLYHDNIAALPFGPVPSYLYDALKIARGDAKAQSFHQDDDLHIITDAITFQDEIYTPTEQPDMEQLSRSAIECIDLALSEVSQMTFDQIVNTTHGEEWNRAFANPTDRSMSYLAIAKEGGADEASLAYLKETLELDAMLQQ